MDISEKYTWSVLKTFSGIFHSQKRIIQKLTSFTMYSVLAIVYYLQYYPFIMKTDLPWFWETAASIIVISEVHKIH